MDLHRGVDRGLIVRVSRLVARRLVAASVAIGASRAARRRLVQAATALDAGA
jgi:hypothetical protein